MRCAPSPVDYPDELDVDRYRSRDCEHLPKCLRKAAAQDWPRMSCGACELAPEGLLRPRTKCEWCQAEPPTVHRKGHPFCSRRCLKNWYRSQLYFQTKKGEL